MKHHLPTTLPAALLTIALGLGAAGPAAAVDLDAGDYDPAKPGVTLALLYLQHAERDSLDIGGRTAPGDYRLNTDLATFRLVHYVSIAGLTVAPQILVPVVAQRGLGDSAALGRNTELSDIILAAPVWLVNRPDQNTYFGITPYVWIPTGSYDPTRALNAGENRWKLNLQAAGTIRLAPKLAWDAGADVTFYGRSGRDTAGGQIRQHAGYQLQTSARYFLGHGFDLRAGISHAEGGDSTQNGVTSASFTQTKYWVGTALKPSATTQVIVTYGQDLVVRNGYKEANRVNVRLLVGL